MGQGEAAVHAEGGRALRGLLSYCCITCHWWGILSADRSLVGDDTRVWGSPSSLAPSVSCLCFVIYAIQQNVIVAGKGMGVGAEGPGNITVSTWFCLLVQGLVYTCNQDCSGLWLHFEFGVCKSLGLGLPYFVLGFETSDVLETTQYLYIRNSLPWQATQD